MLKLRFYHEAGERDPFSTEQVFENNGTAATRGKKIYYHGLSNILHDTCISLNGLEESCVLATTVLPRKLPLRFILHIHQRSWPFRHVHVRYGVESEESHVLAPIQPLKEHALQQNFFPKRDLARYDSHETLPTLP